MTLQLGVPFEEQERTWLGASRPGDRRRRIRLTIHQFRTRDLDLDRDQRVRGRSVVTKHHLRSQVRVSGMWQFWVCC